MGDAGWFGSDCVAWCAVSEPESLYEREDAEQQLGAEDAVAGQDSMEQLLWQVEALQVRVKKQKHLLRKEAAARKSSAPSESPRAAPGAGQKGKASVAAVASPRGVGRGGVASWSGGGLGRTSSGGGLVRRKASDYDISNMVMPVNVGGMFVEQVRHVDIETPMWRVVDDASPGTQRAEESSSEEEIEEEDYRSRHAAMETVEKQQRYMPAQRRSGGDIQTVGKGKLKVVGVGKGGVQMGVEGSSAGLGVASGASPGAMVREGDSVPKRQRSSRNSGRRAGVSIGSVPAAPGGSVESMVVKWEAVKRVERDPDTGADGELSGLDSRDVGGGWAEDRLGVDRMDG
uniref:PEHE domain-containing protein n=1 Tax=Physcomitrium patens TaxID=3218 RepID=A0A7I4C818_PHYPA